MQTNCAQSRRAGAVGLFATLIASLALAGTPAPQAPSRVHVATFDASMGAGAVVDPSGTVILATPASHGVELQPAEKATAPIPARAATANTPCPNAPLLTEEEAKALVLKVAREEDFYPDFVLALAQVESNFKSNALSDKGAFGLMQLMPATAKTYNIDICQPKQNVLGSIRFLRYLHDKYKNPFFILAAYNAGEAAVQQSMGVPPLPETVRFVANVMNNFYEWPQIEKGRSTGRRGASRVDRPSGARAPETNSRWAGGFVMHLDKVGVEQEESQK